MPLFNPDRPYAEVYGTPGVKWQQGGSYFRMDGLHVTGDPDRERELREIRERIGDPDIEPEVREGYRERLREMTAAPPPLVIADKRVGSDDMRLAENRRLKAQMEIYSEPWQGVDHAKQFLEGKAE